MNSPHDLNSLIEQLLRQVGAESGSSKDNTKKTSLFNLTPAKALVIVGLLTEAMEVNSVLVDKDQEIQIVLSGSLRRKTELDKMLDEIGPMPFDQVLEALMRRL